MGELSASETIILGAGLAGLMAARTLTEAGHPVTVVDKSRGVGGRLGTRRFGGGRADHGAQFFSVREPEFAAIVERWRDAGRAYEWSRGWSRGSHEDAKADGHVRFAAKNGMNQLAADLAADLPDVRVNTKITEIRHEDSRWHLFDDAGDAFTCSALILTAPVPQSLTLLSAGNVTLDTDAADALLRIDYAPCLCVMLLLDRPANLPAPGAIQRPGHWLPWLADNQAKGVSPLPMLTLHADAAYSAAHFDLPETEILANFEPEWRPYAPDARVVEAQIKRWRFSMPTVLHPERSLVAMSAPPLIFAGDAFGEARVEGAAMSGLDAARQLTRLLARR